MRLGNFQIIAADFGVVNTNMLSDTFFTALGGLPKSLNGFKTFFTLRENFAYGSILSAAHYIIASANDFNDIEKWYWSVGSTGQVGNLRVYDALSANPHSKDNEERYIQGDYLFVGKLTKTS